MFVKVQDSLYGFGELQGSEVVGRYINGKSMHASAYVEITEFEYLNSIRIDDYVKINFKYYSIDGQSPTEEDNFKYGQIQDKQTFANHIDFQIQYKGGRVMRGPFISESVYVLEKEEYAEETRAKKGIRADVDMMLANSEIRKTKRDRTQTDRLDPLDDAASFDRQKTKVRKTIAAEKRLSSPSSSSSEPMSQTEKRKSPISSSSAQDSDVNATSVRLTVKGLEKNISFEDKIVKYIESDNKEWVESLLKDKIQTCLRSYNEDKLDMLSDVLKKFKKMSSKLYSDVLVDGHTPLEYAIINDHSNSVEVFARNLKYLEHQRILLPTERKNVLMKSLVLAADKGSSKSFNSLCFLPEDSIYLLLEKDKDGRYIFEYALRSDNPQHDILRFFADIVFGTKFRDHLNLRSTPRKYDTMKERFYVVFATDLFRMVEFFIKVLDSLHDKSTFLESVLFVAWNMKSVDVVEHILKNAYYTQLIKTNLPSAFVVFCTEYYFKLANLIQFSKTSFETLDSGKNVQCD